MELSDWQETTATAQFPLALYALVDGKYLVPDGELAAGTAYLALDSMGLRGRNVIPLESITMLTRIRYARADGTFAESWVSSDTLTENDAAPAAPKREPIPTLESYQITLNGTAYTAFAINKVEKGYDTFGAIAGTQTAVVDVLTNAAQGVIAEYGVDASDLLCRTVVEYGYRADKGCWQLDLRFPSATWRMMPTRWKWMTRTASDGDVGSAGWEWVRRIRNSECGIVRVETARGRIVVFQYKKRLWWALFMMLFFA